MKNKTFNALHVWKQMEDLAIPILHLSPVDRAVYSHLLRHSRLEGKRQLRFSIRGIAQRACLSAWSTRRAVRSLVANGALRLATRGRAGHLVHVRLPEEIRTVRADKITGNGSPSLSRAAGLEAADFLQTRELPEAIHRREGGFCFYCSRRLSPKTRCLDHVIPLAQMGGNSYRNLVSCCAECNSLKGERRAPDFVRWLFRDGRITSAELRARLRSLKLLASGKLLPVLPRQENKERIRLTS